VQYSTIVHWYNAAMVIVHFFVPFTINLISATLIIFAVARQRSTIRKQQSFHQHLREQLNEHKHLIISPCILIILALPRLVISFTTGCMKSPRNPWIFLVGYFVSFVPQTLTFIVFVLPSSTYKRAFQESLKRIRAHF
jgi:hypothetical protein